MNITRELFAGRFHFEFVIQSKDGITHSLVDKLDGDVKQIVKSCMDDMQDKLRRLDESRKDVVIG